MLKLTIKNNALLSLRGLQRALTRRGVTSVHRGARKGSETLYARIKTLLRGGSGPGGKLKSVTDSTMQSPIRKGRVKRVVVNPDRTKPIQATGKTIAEIQLKSDFSRGQSTFSIQPGSEIGAKIFARNESLGRMVFEVTGNEVDIIENAVLSEIEKAIAI